MGRKAGIVALGALLVGFACNKQQADTIPPDPTPPPDAGSSDGPAAAEVEYAYKTTDPGQSEDEPADATKEAEATAADDALTPQKAAEIVEAAVDEKLDAYAPRVITPALPTAWPPAGDSVMYLVYPLAPLETGVTKYRVSRAALKVTLSLSDRQTSIEELKKGKTLGTLQLGREGKADDPIHRAEQALFDVSSGQRTAQKVHYLLKRYAKWLDGHGVIAKDVRKRVPAFVSFVQKQ